MNELETRNKIIEELKSAFIGPVKGEEEELDFNPLNLYMSGILYPQSGSLSVDSESEEKLPNDDVLEDKDEKEVLSTNIPGNNNVNSDENTDELTLASTFKPSALGISLIVNKEVEFKVQIRYSHYTKRIEKNDNYEKAFYKNNTISKEITFNVNTDLIKWNTDENINNERKENSFRIPLHFVGEKPRLELAVTKRDYNGKYILTLTLINSWKKEEVFAPNEPEKNQGKLYDVRKCFFRNEIIALAETPCFFAFDDFTDLQNLSIEELNLKLLYRKYKIYGQGHGCAVGWNDLENSNEEAKNSVFSQVIPDYKVNNSDFDPVELQGNPDILFMKNLAGESFDNNTNKDVIIPQLNSFANVYAGWIVVKRNEINDEIIDDVLKEQGNRNLSICTNLYDRMVKGIEILNTQPNAYKCFCDANKAMFMQRAMAGFIKERKQTINEDLYPNDTNNGRSVNETLPDWNIFPAEGNTCFNAKWRPFQLAFFLSQIDGIVDPESADRDTVDLIWFATGGGKTEAYLGVTAFTIFYRRLREQNPDDGAGVAAMMRYTLRLLNMQQFQRASSMICACELIRRSEIDNYGNIPISLGIWVGSITPNKWKGNAQNEQFHESFLRLQHNPNADDAKYNLPIFSCPCCGTKLIKTGNRAANTQRGNWGIIQRPGTRGGVNYHGLMCTNSNCSFYINQLNNDFTNKLPIYFIDEDIYNERPSLLFATVDKYANINWNPNSFRLFNYNLQNKSYDNNPPELIIQDELHLINSTLGTIYGVYEIAIDKLCSGKGVKPKVIAATATVRNADKQCKQLYARSNFMQFPPAGIDADDSFYSRKKKEDKNARIYIGLQPYGLTNISAQVRLVSMLMQRIPMLDANNIVMDNYFTSLIYFNTLKELGLFKTLLADDIVQYRNFLAKDIFKGAFVPLDFEIDVAELSSFRTGTEINAYLDRIEKTKLNDFHNAREFYLMGVRQKSDIDFDSVEFHRNTYPNIINKPQLFQTLGLDYIEGDDDANKAAIKDKYNQIFNTLTKVVKMVEATNMIAVGVDIARLNVMQVTGQPKSHSEYIQASSRVGRQYPGLIITTFNPAKNRDRSHFENFISYHQAFYKDVESTTVTPYSEPALEKALAAVLIALMQAFHYGNSDHPVFNQEDKDSYDNLVEEIRIRTADDNLKENLDNISNKIKSHWEQEFVGKGNDITFSNHSDYIYNGVPNNPNPLRINNALYIKPEFENLFGTNKLKCMSSLRNVEFNSLIDIYKQ